MSYFTVLFFVVVFAMLAFMVFQAVNFWRSRPRTTAKSKTRESLN